VDATITRLGTDRCSTARRPTIERARRDPVAAGASILKARLIRLFRASRPIFAVGPAPAELERRVQRDIEDNVRSRKGAEVLCFGCSKYKLNFIK